MSNPTHSSAGAGSPRVGTAVRALVAVAATLVAALPLLGGAAGHGSAAAACGTGELMATRTPGLLACAHADQAPSGVDVTEPVSTRELRDRTGGGTQAYAAAEDLGVPSSAAGDATGPAVTCDGDGASGYRVQAMYVVEADKPNRFAGLRPSFKLWAAGVDDVVNRSAALTGGVRNLRYVTETGPGGTCEAKVLNVTVPAGSMSSFGATINAVAALGYSDPARKYLMWTDASSLCGIAQLYLSDDASQRNANNGSHPQYARVDSGCWGLGNLTGQHSVEAHEIVHTLGAVSQSARHSTPSGHCWDESDTMCYADAGSHAMVQVCPAEREYLLDCGSDDYFSTFPDPGSYLQTHWNAASSRFLVGGGDGIGGGSAGAPTTLGATIGVNNPAVPGLVTQVTVSPVLPAGRTVSSVAWTSLRKDCVFEDTAAEQTTVSCPASASAPTKVTAVVTDSTGATRSVTSALTFATRTARAITLTTEVDGQGGAAASVCHGASFAVAATAVDAASGLPVRGLPVSFTRRTAAMAAPATVGAALSQGTGVATTSATAALATTYAAKTLAGTVYAAGASTPLVATPSGCVVSLNAEAGRTDVYYGDTVTVSGTLTRELGGRTLGVNAATVPLVLRWTEGRLTRAMVLSSARTTTDGSFTAVLRPTRSGTLSADLAATKGWASVTADLGPVTVRLPTTDLTAAVDTTDVGHGSTVRVTGRLTRTAATASGVAGAAVSVRVTAAGTATATVVGSGRTSADGTYAVAVPLRTSGTMTVVYLGAPGLVADSANVGAVTVGTWTPALSLAGSRAGTSYNLTGTVSRTYRGATQPGSLVAVKIYFAPTSTGVAAPVGSATAGAGGSFALRVSPKVAGAYTARIVNLAGYSDASSGVYPVS